MAHGLPEGFVRLFNEKGNAVDLALRQDGTYALATQDDPTRRLLEEILEELKTLNGKE